MKCWICGEDGAGTREHKTAAADLRAFFRKPSQKAPLYFHTEKRRNRPVGSVKSDVLKFEQRICATCNNELTQPYDFARAYFFATLLNREPPFPSGDTFRANRIFSYETRRSMRCLHLYFVKWFGCMIAEHQIPIDLKPFSDVLLSGKSHPNLYLRFGCFEDMPVAAAGGTEVRTVKDTQQNDAVVFATCIYHLGRFGVNVIYSEPGQQREGLRDAWHPRFGAKHIMLCKF